MDNKEYQQDGEKVNLNQSRNIKSNISVNYWLAFFFGAIIASVIIVSILPSLANHVKSFIKIVGWITIILATIFLFVTIFKEGIFKFFLGFSQTDFKEIQESGESLFDNYQKEDWQSAKEDVKIVAKKGLAWYSWKNYRLWVIQLFQILFLGFVGLFGSMLLYNQNRLLEKQNEKIDNQIQLEESNRRGNLIVMMSNIMDKVDDELKENIKKDSSRVLTKELIARISALSYAFRPYRFWQDSSLIETPLSPERGQLLLALINSDLSLSTHLKMNQKATFDNALLENTNLSGAKLRYAKLNGANLMKADLVHADLVLAHLKEADMRGAFLGGADFSEANLQYAKLSEAFLDGGTNLGSAWLYKADLRGADLSQANLKGADLRHTNLSEAYLFQADLSHANLKGADLTMVNLNEARVHDKDWLTKLEAQMVIGYDQILEKYVVDTIPQKNNYGRIYHLIKEKK